MDTECYECKKTDEDTRLAQMPDLLHSYYLRGSLASEAAESGSAAAAAPSISSSPIPTIESDPRMFPLTSRPRRLRKTAAIRGLVRETHLRRRATWSIRCSSAHGSEGLREEISDRCPGSTISRRTGWSTKSGRSGAPRAWPAVTPVRDSRTRKDESGSEAWNDDAAVQVRREARSSSAHPDTVVMTDVCLCEYTSHGHCGVVRDGEVVNDRRRSSCWPERPCRTLVPGRTWSRPFGHDGRSGSRAIRGRCWTRRGLPRQRSCLTRRNTLPLSTVRFARRRDSTPQFGDRPARYQMDPANSRRGAVARCSLDLDEGADIDDGQARASRFST